MTPSEKGIDVFISYAHQDRNVATKLVQFLERQGWSVWWDADMAAGSIFDKLIEENLKAARCVIVVWSSASVKSQFVFDEARRAYQRGVVVPVLLDIDETGLPLGFGRIQCVALTARDGYGSLQRAIEAMLQQPPDTRHVNPPFHWYRLVGVLAALITLMVIATTLFWRQSSYEARYLALRPGGGLGQNAASDGMIGLTLWAFRPSTDKDPPHARMLQESRTDKSEMPAIAWTPVRVTSNARLREGSKVRLGIESSRDGFAYVLDRELHGDQRTGLPQLIFPTLRTRGPGNRVIRGCRLELPVLGAPVISWDLNGNQPDYSGELLTIIISPKSIPELEDHDAPIALPDSLVSEWERDWGAGAHIVFNGPGGALPTPAEAQARAGCSYLLTSGDVAPTTIYSVPARGSKPMLTRFTIMVIPKL